MIEVNKIQIYAANPMEFFADAVCPAATGDVRLGDVWADFQRDAFQVLADCLKAVAVGDRPKYRGVWLERTKGASKDSDVGLGLLWLLMFAKRPQIIELGADDLDQILQTSDAMQAMIRANPLIESRVDVLRSKIICEATSSECRF